MPPWWCNTFFGLYNIYFIKTEHFDVKNLVNKPTIYSWLRWKHLRNTLHLKIFFWVLDHNFQDKVSQIGTSTLLEIRQPNIFNIVSSFLSPSAMHTGLYTLTIMFDYKCYNEFNKCENFIPPSWHLRCQIRILKHHFHYAQSVSELQIITGNFWASKMASCWYLPNIKHPSTREIKRGSAMSKYCKSRFYFD